MEKRRAIELLKLAVPIKALTQQEYADFVKAVNMGMDALEQPTSPDTIDRKAALDALRRCQTYLYDARDQELKIELSSAEAAINNLSTIQPVATDTNVGDKISRQQAIELIKNYCENGCDIAEDNWCPSCQREQFIKLLKALPTVPPEPQWIPVSERLPEKGGEYLVSVRWYREDDIDIDVYDYDARCKEWNDGESCGQRVIAWMPLPVVYKPSKK